MRGAVDSRDFGPTLFYAKLAEHRGDAPGYSAKFIVIGNHCVIILIRLN